MRTIQEIKANKEALEKFIHQAICQFEEMNGVKISALNHKAMTEINYIRPGETEFIRHQVELEIKI